MGIACTMGRVLQRTCTTPTDPPPPPPPPGGRTCFAIHPDSLHSNTWIVDEIPDQWVGPFTTDWGDGNVESSGDGEDAHEFSDSGTYVIRVSDSEGRTCAFEVTVPHT